MNAHNNQYWIKKIISLGFNIESMNFDKPWGGYICIDNSMSEQFIKKFFSDKLMLEILKNDRLSIKILFVNPNSSLSWQYHNRRKEAWSVVKGKIGVFRSKNNYQNRMELFNKGDQIEIKEKERHRIVGLDIKSIIAEVWINTDIELDSCEDDIVRIDDEYDRIK